MGLVFKETRNRGEGTICLQDNLSSGNGYKVRLLLTLLGVPFERIEYDIDKNEMRTTEFLETNPNGRIPVLETESGEFLPRIERDPVLPGRWDRVPPRGTVRASASLENQGGRAGPVASLLLMPADHVVTSEVQKAANS